MRAKNYFYWFIFPVLMICLFAFPASARADIAPPINPGGSNLLPGKDGTQVRMLAETVILEVSDDHNLGTAHITADFTMHNTGSIDESMAVRFPISANDGRDQYPEITGLQVKAGGRTVATRRTSYPAVNGSTQEVPWAEFDLSFPAGKDVQIQVTYNIKGSGYYPYTAFYYILETGSGWFGTIGSADIILRLPYQANLQNVVTGMQIGWGEMTPGGKISGNEVSWHFSDFEPGPYAQVQNMEFTLAAPAAWNAILKARTAAEKNKTDSEAWGQLAKSLKSLFLMNRGFRTDSAGSGLYLESVQAYEKCLELNPEDAVWHAGFAELLITHAYFTNMLYPDAEAIRGLSEIHTALNLAPNNPKVQEIAETISWTFPDGMKSTDSGYAFPWLTQTPTAPAPTPTITPVLDPAAVSGIYQTENLQLADGRKAILHLTLNIDQTARLETFYTNDHSVHSADGNWVDNGDGSLSVNYPANDKMEQIIYIFKGDQLIGNAYPGYYGDNGINMQRILPAASAAPTVTAVEITAVPAVNNPQTAPPSAPNPLTRPFLPFCGSAALVGVGLVFIVKKRPGPGK